MILPGTLPPMGVETPETAPSQHDSEISLSGPESGVSDFSAVLHDAPDDEPDDGLSTPDVTQPLGLVHAQSLPKEAQHLQADSAGGPPGSSSRQSGHATHAVDEMHSSGVAWPLGVSSSSRREQDGSQTPLDSMPRMTEQSLRPGIGADSVQSTALPVTREVERVELSLQLDRATGSDARTMLASRIDRPAQPGPGQPGIIRSMTTMALQSGGTMRMRLDPPALGELIVQMSVNRGQVSMAIEATTRAGAEVLSGELATLRSALEQRGFVVERLTIGGPRGPQVEMPHLESEDRSTPDDGDEPTRERSHGRQNQSDAPQASMDAVLETMLELEQGAHQ